MKLLNNTLKSFIDNAYDVEKVCIKKANELYKKNLEGCLLLKINDNEYLYFKPLTIYSSKYNIYN